MDSNNKNTCDICFDDKKENQLQILPCSHHLCETCLIRLKSPLCPFCRQDFSEQFIYQRQESNRKSNKTYLSLDEDVSRLVSNLNLEDIHVKTISRKQKKKNNNKTHKRNKRRSLSDEFDQINSRRRTERGKRRGRISVEFNHSRSR